MSCDDATMMCTCLHDGDYDQVEHLARCILGREEKNQTIIPQSGDDTSSDDSDDADDDDDDYDEDPYFPYQSGKYYHERQVTEGDVIVTKSLNSYAYTLKEEYIPKDAAARRAFYLKFVERVAGRFASEALSHYNGWGHFEALLTEDEHQKLCEMEEVDYVMQLEHRVVLD